MTDQPRITDHQPNVTGYRLFEMCHGERTSKEVQEMITSEIAEDVARHSTLPVIPQRSAEVQAALRIVANGFTNDDFNLLKRQNLHVPDVLAAEVLRLESERDKLREALEACGVFCTPLERLKHWNEYKEDASRRRNEALATTPKGATQP